MTSVCPIRAAITQIRGGFYDEGAEERDNSVIGCGEDLYVCDDVMYRINMRLLDLARFEVGRPDLPACKQKYAADYAWMAGRTRKEIYTRIIDESQMKRIICRQFMNIVDTIAHFEEYIMLRAVVAGRAGREINVTLPDVFMPPQVDMQIIYDPHSLTKIMNDVIQYVNKLGGNILVGKGSPFDLLPEFAGVAPNMQDTATMPKLTTPDDYIRGMRELLTFEIETAKYIQEIERYHCGALNHVNKIYQHIQQIIAG